MIEFAKRVIEKLLFTTAKKVFKKAKPPGSPMYLPTPATVKEYEQVLEEEVEKVTDENWGNFEKAFGDLYKRCDTRD